MVRTRPLATAKHKAVAIGAALYGRSAMGRAYVDDLYETREQST